MLVKSTEKKIPTPLTSVHLAPPNLSVRGLNSTRAPAPMSGPRNANFTGSGIV